ncbi:hypothetical protein BABINDRAFT_158986 [Babjeviella inositovora NRRL Y-12698]|uniref:3',5'-cyclic-nucleotide phosphodiesterase n=1 Tax=Babjeviella inositovora NRRL Y-12698 TaxID=984486 RepID=A0A1E3QXH9_9ASCO|nr:uncharacterized protein BABINDRAFT_158986 [Babjeviella inositovora NRRL Y-12698]ODQ82379.1 hypothetical protein BABINDRAFT_158986 [Babjeviella inositovora NRRL Y-12698]
MSSFEVTVLGASGGPIDGKTCALLVKPASLSYAEILATNDCESVVAIDAGTSLSGIGEAIMHHQRLQPKTLKDMPFSDFYLQNSPQTNLLLDFYRDSLPLKQYINVPTTTPFQELCELAPLEYAALLLRLLSCYCVTHPHLDHVAGLVINSPVFCDYGIPRKRIHGLRQTTEALQKHCFNGVIWPDLARDFLSMSVMEPEKWYPLNLHYSVLPYELAHGKTNGDKDVYTSTAFLLKDTTDSYLLVFGDCESDVHSDHPRNFAVWTGVAPLIRDGKLKSIIIECSTPSMAACINLYGHLSPDFLIQELLTLERCVRQVEPGCNQPLMGLNILIYHVKELFTSSDPRRKILSELEALNKRYNMGIVFSVAFPGVTYLL